MLRYSATHDKLREELFANVASGPIERERIGAWLGQMIAEAQAQRGLIRAWHVASNADAALILERQQRFDASVSGFARYIERLNADRIISVRNPAFNAYALEALCTAIVRESAVEPPFIPAKVAGLRDVILDLLGFEVDSAHRHAEVAVAS